MFHDPSYPSSETLNREQEKLVKWFNDRVGGDEIPTEETSCLCGADNDDVVSTYDRYRSVQRIVLCRACGLMRCNPRLTAGSLEWFYQSNFYRQLYTTGGFRTVTESEYVAQVKSRDDFRRRAFDGLDSERIQRIGEIGCAGGLNLYGLHLEGRQVWGCDPSPEMVAMGRKMGLNLEQGFTERLGNRIFDLVILSHVVEHFPDPLAEVVRIKENLAKGGALYIEVPDARAFCLGALQSAHLYYFTPRQLVYYMAKIGLRPISENLIQRVHFGMVFVPDDNAPEVDITGEYDLIRNIILRHQRREGFKDMLRKLGLFRIAQAAYRIGRHP